MRFVALVAGVVVLAALLTGCGSDESTEPSPPPSVSASRGADEKVRAVRDYLRENPGIGGPGSTAYDVVQKVTVKGDAATLQTTLRATASGRATARRICGAVASAHVTGRTVVNSGRVTLARC